ncbi:hypothetical protein X975_09996, partial [Stegodyphus mimosarum]
MNKHFFTICLVVALSGLVLIPSVDAGHKLKLKKIAKMLLLANALTGKKILLPLPLPLPVPVFQENIKHIPYEVKSQDYGMGGGYGGGIGGGFGGGMNGGYGGGYGGGMGGGMKGGGWW